MSKLIISFNALSDAEFLAKAELINASLTGNVNFPEPWTAQLPTLAELTTAVDAYQAAYNEATGGSKASVANRKQVRDSVTTMLKNIAPYLEIVAQGSETILNTTGYDLRKPNIRGTAEVLGAPSGFKLSRGTISGVLVAHAQSLHGAASYQVQTTDSDPTVATNWADAGTFAHCSKIQLSSLTVGKSYSVRIRGVGTAGPGAWTQAATLVAV